MPFASASASALRLHHQTNGRSEGVTSTAMRTRSSTVSRRAPMRSANVAACIGNSSPVSIDGAYSTPTTRSEEHTSELQSLMRISYAVFCLKKKNKATDTPTYTSSQQQHNIIQNTI